MDRQATLPDVGRCRIGRQGCARPGALAGASGNLFKALACVMLLANAVVQNAGLFGMALTLSMTAAMVGFVRRISSLFGDKPGEDWDPQTRLSFPLRWQIEEL